VNRGRFFGVAALVGATVGLATTGLELGLREAVPLLVGQFTDLGEPHFLNFRIGILLLPAIGGLAGGTLVYLFAGREQGHGTDLYCRAFHQGGGRLPLRGALLHALGAIGVISCGGSAGPEGPTAALGASVGSFLGNTFKLTSKERRLLLVAGCGAGIGAIFQCPLGGALFAVSVLYREPDFETDAMAPACIASVVGYSVYMSFWGYGEHLLEGASLLSFTSPAELLPYLVLGVLCGFAALLFRSSLRLVEHVASGRLRLPRWLAAGFGGLGTGALACVLPQVMDGEHAFIQNAMDGGLFETASGHSWWFWAAVFGAVAVFKCIATGMTVGSGAPGGVLGPSVFIGGALGAFVGAIFATLGPEAVTSDPDNLRRALIPVGMAGLLSGR
jgi:CIC family chloride channel protein